MAKEVFKDIKGYYLNYNTLEMGGHKFTLKNFKEVIGHDDSLPYVATLYIDNKKVCNLYNDGWGGQTNIIQVVNQKLVDKANADVKGLPYPKFPWDDMMFVGLKTSNITEIADIIAFLFADVNKTVKKYGAKFVVIALKGEKIKTAKLNPKGSLLSDAVAKASEDYCNTLINQGWIIVNAPHIHYYK